MPANAIAMAIASAMRRRTHDREKGREAEIMRCGRRPETTLCLSARIGLTEFDPMSRAIVTAAATGSTWLAPRFYFAHEAAGRAGRSMSLPTCQESAQLELNELSS